MSKQKIATIPAAPTAPAPVTDVVDHREALVSAAIAWVVADQHANALADQVNDIESLLSSPDGVSDVTRDHLTKRKAEIARSYAWACARESEKRTAWEHAARQFVRTLDRNAAAAMATANREGA